MLQMKKKRMNIDNYYKVDVGGFSDEISYRGVNENTFLDVSLSLSVMMEMK